MDETSNESLLVSSKCVEELKKDSSTTSSSPPPEKIRKLETATSSEPQESSEVTLEEKIVEKSESEMGKKPEEELEGNRSDPYAYLQRDSSSTEGFKLEIRNLPKYYCVKQVQKLFKNHLNMTVKKVKPIMNLNMAYVNCLGEADRIRAIEALNGYKWKGQELQVKAAMPAQDPYVNKNSEAGEVPCEFVTEQDVEIAIEKVTTQYKGLPYESQLKLKKEAANTVFASILREIRQVNQLLPKKSAEEIVGSFTKPDEESISVSRNLEHYRNKCEYSIGYHPVTKQLTVGFRIGSYKSGSTAVAPVDLLIHQPRMFADICTSFKNFITGETNHKPFDPVDYSGVWKQLTVRKNMKNDILIMVVITDKELEACNVEDLRTKLTSWAQDLPITAQLPSGNVTLYFKTVDGFRQSSNRKPELLYGPTHLTETLLGIDFTISPESFFQVNTLGAEDLYSKLIAVAKIDKETSVIDVCCGTGTIAICLADYAGEVIGVEMEESAVLDARRNAAMNKRNCEFFCGKAEDILDLVIARAKFPRIIAIVDPPRAGLNRNALLQMRRVEKIETIYFIACDVQGARRNFVDLARPQSKTYKGNPFYPTAVDLIDMFPQTPNYEAIVTLQRHVR